MRAASWYQRWPSRSSRPTAPVGARLQAIVGAEPAEAEQATFVVRAQAVDLGVIGKHAGEEQGKVAEAAVDAGTLLIGHDLEQRRQPHRVELAEPAPTPSTSGVHPDRAARHTGVRGQQLGDEQAVGGRFQEVEQVSAAEHRQPPARPDPFVDMPDVVQLVPAAMDDEGERQER